jgi:6-phosphogluconolactonase
MASPTEIHVLDTPEDLFRAAASEFAAVANAAVSAHGRFCVALSGGSTPKSLYTLLASGAIPSIPWEKIYFFFGDERDVPPNDPESNYRMANEAMLSKAPVPSENVFRVRTEEKDVEAAALAYEQTIRSFFGVKPGAFPRFDLILLGMGPDGHTASLFPGTAALQEANRLVVANWVEKFKTYRITFTLHVLNNAACTMFLVSGPEKADKLREVLEGNSQDLPSARVRPSGGRLIWFVDRAAAAGLSGRTPEKL